MRCQAREIVSGEACDGLGRLIAISEEDCGPQICATDVVWAGIAIIPGAVSDRCSIGKHSCPGERYRRSMPGRVALLGRRRVTRCRPRTMSERPWGAAGRRG